MIRKEDSRFGFPSTCDRAKKGTTPPSIRSLSTCDNENKNRSPHRIRSVSYCDKGNKKKSPSTRNEDGTRSSSESKPQKVNEESSTLGGMDGKSDDSGKKTIRKHLHVRAYKKLFTKHAKAGGNHGDKCVKEKSPQQGCFMNFGANNSKEVKVSGDVGIMKEGIQDEIDLCVETTETVKKIDSKNIKLSELCNHDSSEMNVESPLSMLEKLDVGDGSINNKQISEEKMLFVPKDFTSTQTKHNICLVCKEPGQLIYHLSCFNPLLHDVPPGAWLCYFCVKKKMDLGAQGVSDGIESVWDVVEGMQNGKQYFIKYKGLAHIHNRWIPESELLHEAPLLFAIFGKNGQKEGNKWRKEWTEPERLLQKRLVASLEVADELTSVPISEPLSCCVEWFVKWKGLEYDQATWELEYSLSVNSSDSQMLIKDYECRREQVSKSYDPLRADKALQVKRDPFCKMSKLPDECPVELDNDHLSSVNCLREYWYKSVNALFIDGQERISKSILFVLSLQSHACRPSLIITTSGSLKLWQAGFLRLAPSVNVLIYHGDKDVRRMLRSLEFYDECGRLMFQVLLADPMAITEDLVNIAYIGWESIIVDECQNSKITRYFEHLNTLNTDFKLLLFNGELKDSLSEHRVLLSFLDSEGTMDNDLVGLKANSTDAPFALTKLKEKLARHIVFESKTDSPKFLEYWVPVPLSNVQLEQYCSTLVSNATVLRSNLRSDVIEALHNILITARKCCDHPYLVDGDLRGLLTKGLQGAEFLNAEVCASGKLYLLGKILQDMKDRGLRVVILFQSLGGPEKVYLGDVLDDFLHQRFGVDTYERIGTGIAAANKFAALEKFNNKETGKFVFLIEKRACLPSVKLHSVDAIILFNSDWNPLNDLRSLQKINVESQYKCTRVFRFYTSYTVEEKLLMLAKDIVLESCVENINRNITHLLLGWGTSYLFQKLDHLHSSAKPASITEASFDKLYLNDVIMEILTQFPGKTGTSRAVPCSILTRAQLCGGMYSKNIVLAGEKEGIFLLDKDLSSFWSGLLEGRHPKWMHISDNSQRVRRRIQNYGLAIQAVEGDEVKSKRRKIDSNVDPVKLREINKEKEDGPEENHKSCMLESEDGKEQLEDQRNLLMLLRPELSELCDILGQPEFVKDMAQKFLLYIMTNHNVSANRNVLQALKISLCWRAASMSGHSLDRCESLSDAKKHLKFECTDEEAYSVYSKLQILEEKFPCQTGALENLSVENILDNQSSSKIVNDEREALDWRAMDTEATGNLSAGVADGFHIGYKASEQLLSLQSHPIGERPPGIFQPDFGSYNENPIKNQIDVIDEVFSKRSKDLVPMQLAELWKFQKQMKKNRLKLEETHELDLKLIRSIHIDERTREEKINILRQEFFKELGRFDQHRKQQKQKLLSMQHDMLKKEEELKYRWLEKAKTGVMDESVDAIPRLESGLRLEEFLEASEFTTNYRKSGATILDSTCPSDGTIIGSEARLEVPSNILNEQEENVRLGDDTCDDLEQNVQNRLAVETANCPGLSGVLPMESGISASQSEVFKPFSSCPAELINGSITVECFNFKQQECRADSNVQLGPNAEPKQAVSLTSVQGLTSYVPVSTLPSMQGLCTNKHTRPAEALTKDNNHDIDSAQGVTDSVVNLSPHIEMMTCNDVAPSNSTNIPLPRAEHEQERLPPTGYQKATPQPHLSVEPSEVPAQQKNMNIAFESNPSNSQIPENAIQPLRPQEYLPSEGIPSEQADITVQAAVSEGEPSIQQIPEDVAVTASDSVVNLSPHIEMMTCNDIAPSNSSNIPLPRAEHEQEKLPPTGYQEATSQPHLSVELSEVPAQQENMNVAFESNPSNSQIPENAIQPLIPQEYLPSEGIPSEPLGNTVIQYGMACDWSHSSIQQADVTVQAAVSEGEPSIQQIPENNLHPMRPHEVLQFERTHSEHLRSTDIQLNEPSQFFQSLSSMEWLPPQAISADPISNELVRVQRQDILCTRQHEKKKLLLQSGCDEEMEKVRKKYDILLQDAQKEYLQQKNILFKIFQKIRWHKAFAEDVSSNFYDHKKGSSTSFQGPSQNSSQHPQPSCPPAQLTTRPSSAPPPAPLSTPFQPQPSQTTNQASTSHFLPISRPQAFATGLTTHASPLISGDRVVGGRINPRGMPQIGPMNPRPNLHAGRSPAPHLQRGRSPHVSDPTLNTPLASVASLQPTPLSLVSTASPVVPPPNLASFSAPFPFMDTFRLNAFGTSQPAGFGPSPRCFGVPQFELPHYAGPDDGLLESMLANCPAAEAHAETLIDLRPIASPDFIYLSDEDELLH